MSANQNEDEFNSIAQNSIRSFNEFLVNRIRVLNDWIWRCTCDDILPVNILMCIWWSDIG
jgi:hypothetical protein